MRGRLAMSSELAMLDSEPAAWDGATSGGVHQSEILRAAAARCPARAFNPAVSVAGHADCSLSRLEVRIMVERRRTPKDPEDTKGGVRGTHGHGDAARDRRRVRPVGAQGGTASRTGETTKGESARRLRDTERPGQEELEEIELGDPARDEETAYEHNLATRKTPGPGPKDHDAGRARARDLDERRVRRKT